MHLRTIEWHRGVIKSIDQTQLPGRLTYLHIKNVKELWSAIKTLQVRGAPALGAAAALGVYLGIKDSKAKNFNALRKELDAVANFIATSRPTARNLFWGIERVCSIAVKNKDKSLPAIKSLILREAQQIIEEDRRACRTIGRFGSRLIKDKDTVLTICNAGIFATIDYGTALGVIYRAKQERKRIKVYVCETRPLLQGARLTTWELKKHAIDVTLICDNMAATLMQQGRIDLVITGADRIAANGDAANKIGTYNLAVLSRYHGIPFYIAAPLSTFDLALKKGKDIPIEERNPKEVSELFFKRPIAARGIKIYNPAFDVTPNSLITALITEKGIIRPPYRTRIARTVRG